MSSPATPASWPGCRPSRMRAAPTGSPPTPSCSRASCPSWRWSSTRRCASTRPRGSARGARWSPSSSRAPPFRLGLRQLLLLGLPPSARRVRGSRGVPPERFTPERVPRCPREPMFPSGRLAHLHRDALRTAGGARHRGDDPQPLHALGARRLSAEDPPDAHHQPQGGLPVVVAQRPRSARESVPAAA